jgi:hypothetical protein
MLTRRRITHTSVCFRVLPSLTFRRQVVVAGEVADEKLQAAKKFKSYFNTRRRNNGTIS